MRIFKKTDTLPPQSKEMNVLIQRNCVFDGRMQFEGTARIDGEFTGEIFSPDMLVIGEEAIVSAKIEAGVVVIAGKFTGDIHASERIEIQSLAEVKGHLKTLLLEIEEGALFEGKTTMLSKKRFQNDKDWSLEESSLPVLG